jgi:hypothetical protein
LCEEEGREKRKEKNIASGDPGMPDSLVFLICELVFSENTVPVNPSTFTITD